MHSTPKPGSAQPFFLPTEPGQRFCLFHPPAGGGCRGAVLYVHPFGEEMNKARRMSALQARALAAAGFGVLQIDLYGCGDSSGDFADARWDIWRDDLAAGCRWLQERLGLPVTLWGLRLGATLAVDFACHAGYPIAQLVLWQPVQDGNVYLTQFLRLLTARAMVSGSAGSAAGPNTTALRKSLLGGEMLEVAGYELAPDLAAAIDSVNLAGMAPRGCPVHWFDTVTPAGRPLAPAVERLQGAWRGQGVDLHLHRLDCAPFWSSQEIEEAPALLAATSALILRSADELSRTGT